MLLLYLMSLIKVVVVVVVVVVDVPDIHSRVHCCFCYCTLYLM